MERFFRLQRLIGDEHFFKLTNSKALVVGLGAVGSYTVEALARAGIGNLTLTDFDTVSKTNINRQLYALESTLGKPKTEVARQRVLDINPDCRVTLKTMYVDSGNVSELLGNMEFDIVIDAIDSLQAKIDLLATAYHKGVMILSSMGAALRTDPASITVADVMDTTYCPLARRVRSGLKKNGIGRGITCVYSREQRDFEFKAPEDEVIHEDMPAQARNRRVLGSMPTITGIFGLYLANLAILKLAGIEDSL